MYSIDALIHLKNTEIFTESFALKNVFVRAFVGAPTCFYFGGKVYLNFRARNKNSVSFLFKISVFSTHSLCKFNLENYRPVPNWIAGQKARFFFTFSHEKFPRKWVLL